MVLTVNGKIPGLSLKTLSGDLTTNPTAATETSSSRWVGLISMPTSWCSTGSCTPP